MILSKFYNRHKEKVNELSGASKNDPRVITPSNIPIFILPTRLEEINPQTTKAILKDSFEENSLPDNPGDRDLNDTKFLKHKLSIDYKNSSALSSRSNSKVSTTSFPDKNRLKIQQDNAHISSSMQNLKSNQTTITTTTKTIIKTLFRNGLLNMPTENIQDEKKFKENYCDLWVLHGDSDSVKNNASRNNTNESSKRASFVNDVLVCPDKSNYLSKSTSILNKHNDDGNINKSKTEEKLQRDYLLNLSKQLNIEKQNLINKSTENQHHNHRTNHNKNLPKFKFKRESRSKSETFLSLQSILSSNNILTAKDQDSNMFSNLNINSSSKELLSQRMLSSIIKKHGITTINSLKHTDKASSNNNNNTNINHHDINTNNNPDVNHLSLSNTSVENRRFSFRNYFFKTKPDSIDDSASNYNLKTLLQSPTGVSANNVSLNNQSKEVGCYSSKVNILKSRGSKASNSKTNRKFEPSTSFSSNSHESIKLTLNNKPIWHSEQMSKSEFNVNKSRNPINSYDANDFFLRQSSTTNFPKRHDSHKETAEHHNHNNSDSENSDLDKIFNEFNNYKKAKSVGRISSFTGTGFVNSRNPRNFQNGHNMDTLEIKSGKGSSSLTKSCRSIISNVFGKNKLRHKSRNETNSPFLTTDNIAFNCDISDIKDNKSKLTSDQNSVMRRKNFFEKMRSNDKFAQNFKFSQCSSVGSDIELDKQFKKIDNSYNNIQAINKKIDYSNPANFDLQNINLPLVEKAFKKNSLLSKPTEVIYLKLNRALMNASNNGRRGSDISRSNYPGDESSSIAPRNNDNFLKNASNFLGFKSNKTQMYALIEVSIERVAQHYDSHVLSIALQNLKVEPLFEINHIKSKLTYVSVQLIDSNSFTEESALNKGSNMMSNSSVTSNSTASPTKSMNAVTTNGSPVKRTYNYLKQKKTAQKFYAKITRNKTQKCKFNANNRSFQKPVDFVLIEEHFFRVTDEAAFSQMQKKFKPSSSHMNESNRSSYQEDMSNNLVKPSPFHKNYIFLFSIELHSYLPISRKTLSSTFRKKKRIFKGQCQIYENFVKNTQFSKKFELHEI